MKNIKNKNVLEVLKSPKCISLFEPRQSINCYEWEKHEKIDREITSWKIMFQKQLLAKSTSRKLLLDRGSVHTFLKSAKHMIKKIITN